MDKFRAAAMRDAIAFVDKVAGRCALGVNVNADYAPRNAQFAKSLSKALN
jgi:hypothetical protein